MVERFNVVSISLFKCACCHAYVVFCAACSDCGLVVWPSDRKHLSSSLFEICQPPDDYIYIAYM